MIPFGRFVSEPDTSQGWLQLTKNVGLPPPIFPFVVLNCLGIFLFKTMVSSYVG